MATRWLRIPINVDPAPICPTQSTTWPDMYRLIASNPLPKVMIDQWMARRMWIGRCDGAS